MYVDKIIIVCTVDRIILTVYCPQQIYVDSGHYWFFRLPILDSRDEVFACLTHPRVRDL